MWPSATIYDSWSFLLEGDKLFQQKNINKNIGNHEGPPAIFTAETYEHTGFFWVGKKQPFMDMATLKPLLKVKLLVGPTCKIPRSTQRGCSGIRRSPSRCAKWRFLIGNLTQETLNHHEATLV